MQTLNKKTLESELKKIQAQLNSGEGATSFALTPFPLTDLLPHITCEEIFFFKSKYKNFSILGLGSSKKLFHYEIEEFLSKNPETYLTANFLFENVEQGHISVPEWLFVQDGEKLRLIIHQNYDEQFSSTNLFVDLEYTEDYSHAPWVNYEESPERDQWEEMIDKADKLFDDGVVEKIVLSRKKIYDFDFPLDGKLFFKELFEKNNHAQNSYAAFYQDEIYHSFMSLTPEKLFSLEGRHFESISLAASAPRGKTPEEDQEFEKFLNTDDKSQREHEIVTREILNRLRTVSKKVESTGRKIMKLPYIQHQSNPIVGELKDDVSALTLVNLLHPTPAVGGLPNEKAKVAIAALEPYKRDQYAAPIGVISKDYSEFAVGIRSGEITKNRLTIFGGAGIVKGSMALDEWNETGAKMGPFLKVINND